MQLYLNVTVQLHKTYNKTIGSMKSIKSINSYIAIVYTTKRLHFYTSIHSIEKFHLLKLKCNELKKQIEYQEINGGIFLKNFPLECAIVAKIKPIRPTLDSPTFFCWRFLYSHYNSLSFFICTLNFLKIFQAVVA